MLKNLLDILALGVIQSLCFVLRCLPDKAALCVAIGCVRLLRILMPRMSGVGRRNLEIVFPEKDLKERNEILRHSFVVFAKNILAFARLPDMTEAKTREQFDYDHYLKVVEDAHADAGGKGIFVVTMHFGISEMFAQGATLLESPYAILARGFGLPKLDKWANARRQAFGSVMFSRKGGYRQMVDFINEGMDVGLMCDQNVKINHATFVDFFGVKASTTKGIGLAVFRTGCPVVFAVSVPDSTDHYRVIAERISVPEANEGSLQERIGEFMRRIHICMEKVIREHPEQWLWTHRRFKTRPPGELENMYH